MKGDYKLYGDLACQTTVQDGMYIAQLPFTPAERPAYRLEELQARGETLLALFPELARCVACNTCTKACPQKLEVMDAVQAALRGHPRGGRAHLRLRLLRALHDALPGGDLPPPRLAARPAAQQGLPHPRAPHVAQRVEEVRAGKFKAELDRLMAMPKEELVAAYKARDIEP